VKSKLPAAVRNAILRHSLS